jgi:hypothetical protein
MTLLVPRPQANPAYAIEIAYPYSLSDGEITLAEVRFIDEDGKRATEEETWLRYRPAEWRAATREEQQEFVLRFGNPKPWYATMHHTYKSVYSYSDSGDQASNNGQEWSENWDEGWEEEEQRRKRFMEEEESWKEKAKAELLRRFERWGEC